MGWELRERRMVFDGFGVEEGFERESRVSCKCHFLRLVGKFGCWKLVFGLAETILFLILGICTNI